MREWQEAHTFYFLAQKEQGQISGKIAQVVLFGINIVIPMIDLEMLKVKERSGDEENKNNDTFIY
jgi:hypothetical protein